MTSWSWILKNLRLNYATQRTSIVQASKSFLMHVIQRFLTAFLIWKWRECKTIQCPRTMFQLGSDQEIHIRTCSKRERVWDVSMRFQIFILRLSANIASHFSLCLILVYLSQLPRVSNDNRNSGASWFAANLLNRWYNVLPGDDFSEYYMFTI